MHVTTTNDCLCVQVCDLGSAKTLEKALQQSTIVGSYAYMAPEVRLRSNRSSFLKVELCLHIVCSKIYLCGLNMLGELSICDPFSINHSYTGGLEPG